MSANGEAPSIRFFDAPAVHAALGFSRLADAIAGTLVSARAPRRQVHALAGSDVLLLMPAWSDAPEGSIGVKLVTVFPGNRKLSQPTVQAVFVLFDRASGVPRAVLDGEALTVRRTAAASLLAARHLARRDCERLLVVGTGRLAPWLARAHCAEWAIRSVAVWGRDPDRAVRLAEALRGEGLPASAAGELETEVRRADIVTCATTSTEPLLKGAWLRAGTHVDLVGGFRPDMREADDDAIARSRLYVDTYEGALAEAGDLVQPLAHGSITRENVVAELAELVTGARAGRRSPAEITLFKSVGTAMEDLAAAELVVRGV
jgi:ornithine cyclodeaminase